MKKALIIVGILLVFILTVFIADRKEKEGLLSGKYNVIIDIENYGEIELELDADTAPITVTNFINLVEKGYYDGTRFHRIMKGFMMQGGQGEQIANIKGEFSSNGVPNNISHVRGVISMARADDLNSASSQFFIVHEDSTFLDGDYAAFGHVTKGIEVIDKVCNDAKPIDNNGTIESSKMPVIKSITMKK